MLKRLLFCTTCFVSFLGQVFGSTYEGVTCSFTSGRFGDHLITYLHARWYAYEHQIPYFYKPFPFSSELVLSIKEKAFSDAKLPGDAIFECPYFPESKFEINSFYHFPLDWQNGEFLSIAQEMIAPVNDLTLISPPKGRITIALHFREGGGVDLASAFQICPWKFPPLSFYIESLLNAVKYFEGLPIYCYVFTDALQPETVIEQIQNALPEGAQVVLDYHRDIHGPNTNVLEDFFSLFNFDVLIRPDSNFSIVPARIHDFAIIYSPKHITNNGQEVRVDQIGIELDVALCDELIARVNSNMHDQRAL